MLKLSVKDCERKNRTSHPDQGVSGLLIVDKPAGWTSHDVVAKLRKILGIRKIGHAGTLDPEATGLLPICVGQATRIVEYLMEIPKAYRVQMKLGESTETEDASGRVIQRHDLEGVTEEKAEAAVLAFQGEILQTPPMYSALKKNGRCLYEYAREGKEIFREARSITIYEIRDFSYDLPYLSFDVRCSKGTYVRSLCRDIGERLGVGAHLTHLSRIESAGFTGEDAHPLSEIEKMKRGQALSLLIPMDLPLRHWGAAVVRLDQARKVCMGQVLNLDDLAQPPERWETNDLLRIYGEDGTFLAVGKAGKSPSGSIQVHPRKVFCAN